MLKTSWLKKYTKLEYLADTLRKQELHLANPKKDWDDKNDSKCLDLYSDICGGFEVKATCLTEAEDRFHFWHIFGERENGVCLWFEKSSLLRDVNRDASLIAGNVNYPPVKNLKRLERRLIPFTKREQYADEIEFRILRVKAANCTAIDKFSFSPLSLKRVYLNPWLTRKDVQTEKSNVSRILGDKLAHVKVFQNRSLKQRSWIDAVSSAARLPM